MNIKIDIEKIADLSMLTLSDTEKTDFSKDLEEIISFAEEVSKTENFNNLKNMLLHSGLKI